MYDQIAIRIINMVEAAIHFATYNLQNQYSKAIYIGFHREMATHCILWGHITTAT